MIAALAHLMGSHHGYSAHWLWVFCHFSHHLCEVRR